MTRLRVVGSMVAAMVAGVVTMPAQATEPGLPFASTAAAESCEMAARHVDSTSCTVRATASAANGAVSAHTRLVSPAAGTAPWVAQANTSGQVTADYNLATNVRELHFRVTVRINHARVSITPGVPSTAGWYVNQYDLGRAAQVNVGAHALHASCSDCAGGTSLIVLSAWKPGTTETTSDRDVVIHVKMTRNGGADIPPGLVTVRAGVAAPVWQPNTWGDESAGVDAVVRKITLA